MCEGAQAYGNEGHEALTETVIHWGAWQGLNLGDVSKDQDILRCHNFYPGNLPNDVKQRV